MFDQASILFVALCSFFPCSLTFFHWGRQRERGIDNEKALELTDNTVFYRDFNLEISPKNATKHPVA